MYMCACIVIIQSLFRIIIYKMLYYKICSSSITVIKELKILYPPDYFPKETLIRIICLCIVWIDFALEVSENFHQCLVQKKDLLVNGILTVLTMGFHGYSFPCPSLTDFSLVISDLIRSQKLTKMALLGLELCLLLLNGSFIFTDPLILNFDLTISYLNLEGQIRY